LIGKVSPSSRAQPLGANSNPTIRTSAKKGSDIMVSGKFQKMIKSLVMKEFIVKYATPDSSAPSSS
jgi:hypothetical protein